MLTTAFAFLLAFVVGMGGGSPSVRLRRVEALRRRLDTAAERVAAAILSRISGPGPSSGALELCGALTAELRAGAPPETALLAATASDHRLVPRARTAALLGEPVAGALADDAAAARAAASPHAIALSGIAACWAVSAHSGAGLADGLDRVAHLAAASRRVADDLAAEVAGPRATARILALLPLLGLLLGELLGASPLLWLVGSPLGWGCLLLGASFLLLGGWWSRRILVAAAPPRAAGRL